MKSKKDITAAEIEKTLADWKNVKPEVVERLKAKAEMLASEVKQKKNAIFTARLRHD